MKRLALIFALSAPALALAQTCDDLSDMTHPPQLLGSPAQCSTSKVLGGGASKDCFWRYPLRSPEARAAFDQIARRLRVCADGPVTVQETNVNHPDSYDQITGIVQGRSVSLSLKDKGGLGETLIFLRRTMPRRE